MGLLDGISNAGQKVKLQGEIVLLNREIDARKKLFGIELWDLLVESEKQENRSGVIFKMPAIFKDVEMKLKEPIEECRKDMAFMEGQLAENNDKLTRLEAHRERETNATIGTFMKNTGSDANLKIRIAKLERDMKLRKEKFGMDVWNLVATESAPTTKEDNKNKGSGLGAVTGAIGGLGKGVVGGVTSTLGKLSKQETLMQDCVKKAKDDVAYLERSKARKQSLVSAITSKN
mmetsp:Transcript_19005/g.28680  ORF Transcript_19005/g.28680 Transcript_19005/m.28680 type:complete len:232 (+) Transcript_19005:125-820(+)